MKKIIVIFFFPLQAPNLISMNLNRYGSKISPDHFEYEFYSYGPRGRIKKIVRFDPFQTEEGQQLINLAFGDWNERSRRIDDSSKNILIKNIINFH